MSEFNPTIIYEGLSPEKAKCQLIWDTSFKVKVNKEECSFDKYSEAYNKYCEIMNISELPETIANEESKYQSHFKKIKGFMTVAIIWSVMAMARDVGTLDILAGFFLINLIGLVSIKLKNN